MEKIAIPCSCGCSVVVFMEFDEFKEEPQSFYAEFYTMIASQPSLRYRLKNAWKVFRNKEHFLHDVCMDIDALKELQDLLNRKLPRQPTTPPAGFEIIPQQAPKGEIYS